MVITPDGYSINYRKNANKIIICLPQTMRTLANTTDPMANRRTDLSPSEEAFILNVVRFVMEGEECEK